MASITHDLPNIPHDSWQAPPIKPLPCENIFEELVRSMYREQDRIKVRQQFADNHCVFPWERKPLTPTCDRLKMLFSHLLSYRGLCYQNEEGICEGFSENLGNVMDEFESHQCDYPWGENL